ncbi:MAG: hypothetical protein JW776_09715 [Candidatus Lokiarchaeota archaeon]|nr:hypothetical protein [Candidatus Lokiarchaeota archaeon]
MEFKDDVQKRKSDVRELQDKAFLMLQQAESLVNEDKKEEAITIYLELIDILNELRWTNITKKIQEVIQELRESITEEISIPIKSEDTTVVEEKSQLETPRRLYRTQNQSLKEFELHKQHEENIQREAFDLMDAGVTLANQKNFEQAIKNYNQAIILLNSIGWQSYTPRIREQIDQWVQDLKNYNISLQKQIVQPELEDFDVFRKSRETLQKEIESRKISIKEFDERKKNQYNYLIRGSQLIRECEVAIDNLNYASIYQILQQAAQNLINVGWQDGVSRLTEIISTVRENQFQHELMEQQEHLAYIEKIRLSDDIRKYFKEKILEKENEKGKPFHSTESSSLQPKTKSYEQQVFETITDASQIEGTDEPSSKRKIELYKVAHHLIEKSQWSEEKSKVQSIIDILYKNLDIRKQRIETLEHIKNHAISLLEDFLSRIINYMKEFDIEKESQKASLLKFQEQQQSIQSIENTAFKYLDEAKKYEKNLEFDSAIRAYEEAIEKFKTLKWFEQIPYMEEEIEKILKLKNQQLSDLQLKQLVQQQEKQQQKAQKQAEDFRKQQELQELQNISKMISGVVKQKEEQKREQHLTEEEYRTNVEIPEEEKQIQVFKELIRKASKKKNK